MIIIVIRIIIIIIIIIITHFKPFDLLHKGTVFNWGGWAALFQKVLAKTLWPSQFLSGMD